MAFFMLRGWGRCSAPWPPSGLQWTRPLPPSRCKNHAAAATNTCRGIYHWPVPEDRGVTREKTLLALLETHGDVLWRIARAYAASVADTEDLHQEILAQVW